MSLSPRETVAEDRRGRDARRSTELAVDETQARLFRESNELTRIIALDETAAQRYQHLHFRRIAWEEAWDMAQLADRQYQMAVHTQINCPCRWHYRQYTAAQEALRYRRHRLYQEEMFQAWNYGCNCCGWRQMLDFRLVQNASLERRETHSAGITMTATRHGLADGCEIANRRRAK